jgi:hypothetical protein
MTETKEISFIQEAYYTTFFPLNEFRNKDHPHQNHILHSAPTANIMVRFAPPLHLNH